MIFPCEQLPDPPPSQMPEMPIGRLAIRTMACGRELGVACGSFDDLMRHKIRGRGLRGLRRAVYVAEDPAGDETQPHSPTRSVRHP